jgi:hypothetical protein
MVAEQTLTPTPADVDSSAPTSPAAVPAMPWRSALGIGAATAVAYALTLSSVPALTSDSMEYLYEIEHGGLALYHPHHLAYNAVGRVWLNLLGALGLGGDALPRVELLNALFGGLAAALVWTLLRYRARVTPVVALAATVGAAFSFGVWFYSVSIEVYLLPLALLLATLLVLTSPRLTLPTMVAVGVLNGAAVVAHQVNVLFAAVVVVVAIHRVDRRTALARLAAYGAAAAGAVIAAYGAVLALVVKPGSPGEAGDWFTAYARDPQYWYFTAKAPFLAAVGFGRSLVGGHFVFRFDRVRSWAPTAFKGNSLDDGAFLSRHIPPVAAGLLVVLAVVGVVLLLWTVGRGLLSWRYRPQPARRLGRPLVAWLIAYSIFFTFWNPTNPEFWIPQATVLWMLAAVLVPTGPRRRPKLALVIAAAAVGLANLFGTILPATSATNDIEAVRYAAVGRQVGGGDLVILDRSHECFGYALRFTHATPVAADSAFSYVVTLKDPSLPTPGALVDQAARALEAGHKVAVDADLVDAPSTTTATSIGKAFVARFGDRWRTVVVPGTPGDWYIIDGR